MKIGALANLVGLSAPTLRYYESLGLLPAAARVSGSRRYGADAADQLRVVLAMKRAGFTLSEIKSLLANAGAERTRERWRRAAEGKLAQLDHEIEELRTARTVLASALDCDCDGRVARCALVAARGNAGLDARRGSRRSRSRR